jgi:hypothetical protein
MGVTRQIVRGILAVLLAAASTGAAPEPPDLESLWKANRWFELRDAVQRGKPPAFYRGAVAAAFGSKKEAIRFLKRANQSDTDPTHRALACGYLAALYDRLGRYREAFDWHRRMTEVSAQAQPPAVQSQSQVLLKAFSGLPDQRVAHHGYSRLACSKDRSVVAIPVEIDSHTACYSLDTSAAFSSVGEAEAARIGLEMQEGSLDLNGVPVRIGVAHELRAGKFSIRNVAFVVFPSDSPVFTREAGILGISVVTAFETIRWSADGSVELGFRSGHDSAAPNMYFNWVLPLIGVDVRGKRIVLQFDTGADQTFLWPVFGKDFPEIAAQAGPIDVNRLYGMFGRGAVPFWPIRNLEVGVGGAPRTFREVKLLAADVQRNCFWCDGTLGVDLAGDAGAVTIDFRAMRVTLGKTFDAETQRR